MRLPIATLGSCTVLLRAAPPRLGCHVRKSGVGQGLGTIGVARRCEDLVSESIRKERLSCLVEVWCYQDPMGQGARRAPAAVAGPLGLHKRPHAGTTQQLSIHARDSDVGRRRHDDEVAAYGRPPINS